MKIYYLIYGIFYMKYSALKLRLLMARSRSFSKSKAPGVYLKV